MHKDNDAGKSMLDSTFIYSLQGEEAIDQFDISSIFEGTIWELGRCDSQDMALPSGRYIVGSVM